MELKLSGKVIMVAAASRGIGFAVARQCAAEGARVSIASRSAADTEQAAEQIRAETGADVRAFCFDAADSESIKAWVQGTREALGPVNGLLVNAGGPPAGTFEDFSDQDWQAACDLTLMSAVRLIRETLPDFQSQGGGSVVAVTSSSVKEPIDSLLLSNVMRSGVTALIKSLATQYASADIRFNTLMPGLIDTDRLKSLHKARATEQHSAADIRAAGEATVPMQRFGSPEEFARAAVFLLSGAASYITGTSLAVDGGKMKTVW